MKGGKGILQVNQDLPHDDDIANRDELRKAVDIAVDHARSGLEYPMGEPVTNAHHRETFAPFLQKVWIERFSTRYSLPLRDIFGIEADDILRPTFSASNVKKPLAVPTSTTVFPARSTPPGVILEPTAQIPIASSDGAYSWQVQRMIKPTIV